MIYGFYKVCSGTPEITVGDCFRNAESIKRLIDEAAELEAALLVLPELCVTGYTCGDLFLSRRLLDCADTALLQIAEYTFGKDMLVFAGAPVEHGGKLYNCAVAMYDGDIVGFTPKTSIPNYGEFYEGRWFSRWEGPNQKHLIRTGGEGEITYYAPFGTKIIYQDSDIPDFRVAAEICEDLWSAAPPSVSHALAGANVIVNLSASDETVGKAEYRRSLAAGQSARLICGYVYADAGDGESTTDMVFAGHDLICENGAILAESRLFSGTGALVSSEIDVSRLDQERKRMNTFEVRHDDSYEYVDIGHIEPRDTALTREISRMPFVPDDSADRAERCGLILTMQAKGLAKRITAARAPGCVVGISGGLDSTLALLASVRAMKLLGRDPSAVTAVTMPCFGTTARTRSNAEILCERLGVSFRCVDIKRAVDVHFADIGHDPDRHDVTYENAQARERTQVLMDIANSAGDLVVGTGDLSELALGWATYNGDHMSMYGVNASIPKTLVRHIVRWAADSCGDARLSAVLLDILDTPVSPELLPADESGEIAQKTEDLVGPYELHDFFLYYFVRFGFTDDKILHLAKYAFRGVYPDEVIEKWLKVFIRRFFAMQFKRSCMPDGPKIGSVALSPRGDWRMPSDASAAIWLM